MEDKLDAFVDSLQKQIFDEAMDVLGEEGFDRWRHPRYRGKPDRFDVHSRATGSCGDSMEIFLRLDGDRVVDASYLTDGCGTSNVCGSFAAEMTLGKAVEEIADITGEAILARLGNVPEGERHCAFLAAGTVQEALRIYMTR